MLGNTTRRVMTKRTWLYVIFAIRVFTAKKGSTTGLSRHIASVHHIMRQTQELNVDKTVASSQPSSSSEADRSGRKRTREEADEDQAQNDAAHDVAKMMAKDDFTANLIAKSSLIQDTFAREGIGAPI